MRTGRPVRLPANPYPLRDIAANARVLLDDMAAACGVSKSSMSRVLLHRQWPYFLHVPTARAALETLLRKRGLPEAEIEAAWGGELPLDHPTPSNTVHSNARTNTNPNADAEPFQMPEPEMLTATAREHFALARNPFVDDVQGPSDVFLSKDQRYIRESMYYAAKHGGFLAVVGESGSGKSTLRRDLLDRIRRENEAIVAVQPQAVDKTALTAAHICDAIIADLSTEHPKRSLEAKSRQVQRILANSARTGNAHVLIIEEAHDISTATLKYLKRFWEMEDGFKKLLGIILVGQPELGDRLDERRNYEAREVIRRCEIAKLRSLNGSMEDYLALKFKRVGAVLADVFETDAFDAIRQRLTRRRPNGGETESHAYPLVVHAVVIKALNAAAELGLAKVNGELVGRL